MKKLITLLLAVALVLSLAACGGNDDSNAQSNKTGSQQAQSENAETDVVHEDEFAIEACEGTVYTDSDGETFTQLSFKVRNLTENTVDMLSIAWQAIDTNGDILDKGHITINDVGAGQAGWTGPANCTIDGELSNSTFEMIKLYRYSVREREEGTEHNYNEIYSYDFNNEVIFNTENITITE